MIEDQAIFWWHEDHVYRSYAHEDLAAMFADENRHVIYFFANPLDVNA